jgi:hypothetical protein
MIISVISFTNDFIKVYCSGVRFMLQSKLKERSFINNRERNKKIYIYADNLFCKEKTLLVVLGRGREGGSMSHNSSSWEPPPSPHTGACDVQYWRRGRLPMSPCPMNNSAAGNAMTPPVWDGTWTSVTPC